jgi:hypothetical protein
MRHPTIGTCLLTFSLALAAGCRAPAQEAPKTGQASPGPSDGVAAAARAQAVNAVARLESKVADARRVVESAGPDVGSLPRAERLHVSDVRRAIVSANVVLQKARAALSNGDAETARQVAEAGAAHLSEVLEKTPAGRPPAGKDGRD